MAGKVRPATNKQAPCWLLDAFFLFRDNVDLLQAGIVTVQPGGSLRDQNRLTLATSMTWQWCLQARAISGPH